MLRIHQGITTLAFVGWIDFAVLVLNAINHAGTHRPVPALARSITRTAGSRFSLATLPIGFGRIPVRCVGCIAFEAVVLWIAFPITNAFTLNQTPYHHGMHALPSTVTGIEGARESVVLASGTLGFGTPAAGAGVGIAPQAIVLGVHGLGLHEFTFNHAQSRVLVITGSSTVTCIRGPRKTIVLTAGPQTYRGPFLIVHPSIAVQAIVPKLFGAPHNGSAVNHAVAVGNSNALAI